MAQLNLFHVLAGSKEPEYRGHSVHVLRRGDHWVAHWGLPDDSTPEYRQPDPRPNVKFSGGFLRGPYESEAEAFQAAQHAVDANLSGPAITAAECFRRLSALNEGER
jgi:hypothetical protein